MRRLIPVLCLVALVAAGCSRGDDREAAVVNGVTIPDSQLKDMVSARLNEQQQPQQQQQQQQQTDIEGLTRQSLEGLIQFQLVLDGAKKAGVEVSNQDVDARVNQIKQQAAAQGSKFEDLLQQNNITEDILRRQLRVQLAVDFMGVKLVPYQGDGALRKTLDAKKTDFEELHVRHVLVKDKATADKVRKELEGDGDWSAVAKQYSTDTGSKDKGGDLGFQGKGKFVPEFEKAAFDLAGQGDCKGKTDGTCQSPLSAPVKSQFGYHVLQVVGLRLPAFNDELRERLDPGIKERRQKAVQTWFQGLLKDAEVSVNPRYGRWDAANGKVIDRTTAPSQPTPSGGQQPTPSQP